MRSKFKCETLFYGIGTNENVDVFGTDLPAGMQYFKFWRLENVKELKDLKSQMLQLWFTFMVDIGNS